MSAAAPQKIPAWIRNLRSQLETLESTSLIRTPNKKLQWDETRLDVGPFESFLMINTASESLMVRMNFGSVSDTNNVEGIFDELPFPPIEVIYNLEPVSKLWILRELYVSETTGKEEIYQFLKESTLIAVVGLQTLIANQQLVEPGKDILAEYGLDQGQRNWGNVLDADKLLSGIGY